MRNGCSRTRLAPRALALGLALLALAAPAAAAQGVPSPVRFAVGSPAMQTAQQIAAAQWGGVPCGGQVEVTWTAQEPTINARAWWWTATTPYGDPGANTGCRVELNSVARFGWTKFCTVIVHEYGHLAGHDHVADGPDVMSPIYRAPLPACVSTPDPGGVARSRPARIS